jgi:hypothetical protein
MRFGFLMAVACLTVGAAVDASGPPVDVAARAKGAAKVVVGTVTNVETGRFDLNEFGDRLIYTRTWVQVDETLKGSPQNLVAVDLEGGTAGDLTLRVSDIQLLRRGERAVLFLNAERNGAHTPNGRGTGVLKLDAAGTVQNTTLTLADLKNVVRSAAK